MVVLLVRAVRARREIRGVISFDASAGPTAAVSRLPLSPSPRPLPLGVLHTRASKHVGETRNLLELFLGESKRSGQRGRCHPGRDRTAIFGWLPVWECRRLGSRGGSLAVWLKYLGRRSLFCGGREGFGTPLAGIPDPFRLLLISSRPPDCETVPRGCFQW